MRKRFLLLMAGIMLTAFAYAQSSQLKGKWVLESATVVQNNNGSTTNLDVNAVKSNAQFTLFDNLTFNNGQVTFVLGDFIATDESATISNTVIQSVALAAPITFTWKIEDGKLYLEREFSSSSQGNTVNYKVSSIYIK